MDMKRNEAIVFVDFEYWTIAYKNLYDILPNITQWSRSLERKFTKIQMYFFADFTNTIFNNYIKEIETLKAKIIYTRDKKKLLKKEMTDFIMLDYIYQIGINIDSPDTFIIFSGDGHFQHVVRFLTQKLKKQVLVYGVMGTFSKSMKEFASDIVEMPLSETERLLYCDMILKYLKHIKQKKRLVTFKNIVQNVSAINNVSSELIKIALNWLLLKGIVYKSTIRIEEKDIKTIKLSDKNNINNLTI